MSQCISMAVSVCLAASVLAAHASDEKKPAAFDAERLVQQLGASKHAEREAASKALEALGVAALPALREAAKNSDAEIRRRAGVLIIKAERLAEAAAAMAPTKVHLRAVDVPLGEVVRDLGKQANVRILLAREPVDLPGRRVTLDTGETSLWEALDSLCLTAKVSIRPSTIDPAQDEINSGPMFVNGPGRPFPGNAMMPNGAVAFTPAVGQANEPVVLQDSSLPVCPTSYLGTVRLRLITDRWINRDRKPGDEMQWTLEVLTEPRMRWVGVPSYRFESRPGLSVEAAPQTGNGGPIPINRRVMMGGMGMVGPTTSRGVTRYEMPVHVKIVAGTTIPELKGALTGTVQATVGAVAAIADVTQEKASATTKDGIRVTARDYTRADDGVIRMAVDFDRGGGVGGVRIGGGINGAVMQVGPGARGAIPLQIAQFVAGPDGALESITLSDDKGRPYQVGITRSDVNQRNGTLAATLMLECRPPAADSKPGALEVHGPRSVAVEVPFILRDVPAVQ